MLGKSIKEYLDRYGIKYSYVAEKIGMPRAAFSAILNGKRKIIVEEYFLICKAIGAPLDTFCKDQAS